MNEETLQRRVAVLGSARLGPDDDTWAVAFELGRLLAVDGFAIVTGGYAGLMAAVSQGAREAGGHVVGLPMTAWTSLEPNEWNADLLWSGDYPERLGHLLACEAVIALDGGVGTLSELAVAWAARQTEDDAPMIVALGERWERLLGALREELVVVQRDIDLVHLVRTPEDVLKILRDPPPTGERRAFG
ncbi:MAG: LOG family protein [Actinomycetota bacterium]